MRDVPPARLLDVPCGTGLLAGELRRLGFSVVGFDLDPTVARDAGIDAHAADMERALPAESGTFDVVTCREGIEHIEQQRAFLGEVARVLAPGGVLVLSTPNVMGYPSRESLARKGYARFFRPNPKGSDTPFEHAHRHPIDVIRLEHLLVEAGFAVEAYDGDAGETSSHSPLRRLRRRLAARAMRKHNPRAELLLHPAVFHSRIVAVRARKAR
jgi:SAM-dependent methyltransferase